MRCLVIGHYVIYEGAAALATEQKYPGKRGQGVCV